MRSEPALAGMGRLVRSARARQGLAAAGRADDRGGPPPLRDDRRPELLVRRGADRKAGGDAVRGDAVEHPEHRAHTTAVLRARVAVGARPRLPRGGAAVVVGGFRNRGGAGGVPRRTRARVARSGTRGRRAGCFQPPARVVLAGGAAVLASGAAGRALAALLRARDTAAQP